LSDDNWCSSSVDVFFEAFSSASRCLFRALFFAISTGVGGRGAARAVGEKRRCDPGMTGNESSNEKKFDICAIGKVETKG
jgi:hypothetical protein